MTAVLLVRQTKRLTTRELRYAELVDYAYRAADRACGAERRALLAECRRIKRAIREELPASECETVLWQARRFVQPGLFAGAVF